MQRCIELLVKNGAFGPHLTKRFGNSLFFVFRKRFLQPINYFILEFLFLFNHPFLYLLFLREFMNQMVLIMGSERGPFLRLRALNEPKVWGNYLFFVFIKMFLQPMIKIFQNFYFILIIHFCIFFFERMLFDTLLSNCFQKNLSSLFLEKCFCNP